MAIKLKGIKCQVSDNNGLTGQKMIANYLINGGTDGKDNYDQPFCYYCGHVQELEKDIPILEGRCKKNQADSAFMFLTVIVLIASITMTYLRMKKGY